MSQTLQSRIGAEAFEKYKNTIGRLESSNQYIPNSDGPIPGVNRFGYAGKYQLGPAANFGTGEIQAASAKAINATIASQGQLGTVMNPNNWAEPGGVQAFLNSPQRQEAAFVSYTNANYRENVRLNNIKPNMSADEVAGVMAASHLVGPAGYKKGGALAEDGNRTKAGTFHDAAKKDQNGAATAPTPQPGNKPPNNAAPAAPPPVVPSGPSIRVIDSSTAYQRTVVPLPIVNPLSEFASFNSIITLSCITKEQQRKPTSKGSYKRGDIGAIIAKNSGAGDSAQATGLAHADNPSGKYDFFIDNLEMSGLISYDAKSGGTNNFSVSFDVMEPYSVGIFLRACQAASQQQGWPSYLQACYLITIDFVGYNNNGDSVLIPNVTRHIPINLMDVSMGIKFSGANYRVTAQPINQVALEDNNRMLDTDSSISGTTVVDSLQSGPNSLQTIVNRRLREFAQKEKTPTQPNELLIVFPTIEPDVQEETEDGRAVGTIDIVNSIVVSRAPGANELIQQPESVNAIGSSPVKFDSSTKGETPVNKQDAVQTDAKKPAKRNTIKNNTSQRQHTFAQGSSIINAIHSVMTHSEYCKTEVAKSAGDSLGFRNWYRIESEVIFLQSLAGNTEPPKLMIYKVVPYKVHLSKNAAANGPVPSYERLREEAAKVYDYIYTGKNTEILSFELALKQAMFNSAAADSGKQGLAAQQAQGAATTTSNYAPKTEDNSPRDRDESTGTYYQGRALTQNPHSGGTEATDYRTNEVNRFYRALYEGTDLVEATMTVMGDPYYLADSGLGNFSNTGTGRFNLMKDGSMDYQNGEVDIIVNFRTPLDYDSNGIMVFSSSAISDQFSGLFRVISVAHKFQRGKFLQELLLQRRIKQEVAVKKTISNAGASSDGNAGEEEARAAMAATATVDPANAASVAKTAVATSGPGPAPNPSVDASKKQIFNTEGRDT